MEKKIENGIHRNNKKMRNIQQILEIVNHIFFSKYDFKQQLKRTDTNISS